MATAADVHVSVPAISQSSGVSWRSSDDTLPAPIHRCSQSSASSATPA